jgi:deoxycytidine triphosphate deaminase
MVINPKKAIENGWIKFPSYYTEQHIEKSIQQNGIDITVDKISRIGGACVLSENNKKMSDYVPLEATNHFYRDKTEKNVSVLSWKLDPQSAYDVFSDFYVKLPANVCAVLSTRSTLSRNGTFVTSGTWDAGFEGHIGCCLHVRGATVYLAPQTRICQIHFLDGESASLYNGDYKHSLGTDWRSA